MVTGGAARTAAAPRRPAAAAGRPPRRGAARRGAAACAAPPPPPPRPGRPVAPGHLYPAKENCSTCGLCDTTFVSHVGDACAFLGAGMSRLPAVEERVHGRRRAPGDADEARFGVFEDMLYVQAAPPVDGAQWTGVVTTIACTMLEAGRVDAVVCVQPAGGGDRFAPRPVVARSPAEVRAARGVRPTLSPNLSVLDAVAAAAASGDVRRLLFIGVGCQVQALRAVEHALGLDALYVLGLNCVDNSPRAGLDAFLAAASDDPETVVGYEFMADYRVHLKHEVGAADGEGQAREGGPRSAAGAGGGGAGDEARPQPPRYRYEKVPYFCLPPRDLVDAIAPSCYACFDYTNGGADLVVGYMGVPPARGADMGAHPQMATVRNARGREMLAAAAAALRTARPESGGALPRAPLVAATVAADDEAKLGRGPAAGAPRFVGAALAAALTALGPRGLEFARYSIDYHTLRNWIHVSRWWGAAAAARHAPDYARRIVAEYDGAGAVAARVAARVPPGAWRPGGWRPRAPARL